MYLLYTINVSLCTFEVQLSQDRMFHAQTSTPFLRTNDTGSQFTFSVEDHARPRPSQSFVCGGCDNVAVLEGTGDDARCYQSTDVSHVSQQVRINVVRNLAKTLVVQVAGIAAHTWKTSQQPSTPYSL